jgi:hypothetical protein
VALIWLAIPKNSTTPSRQAQNANNGNYISANPNGTPDAHSDQGLSLSGESGMEHHTDNNARDKNLDEFNTANHENITTMHGSRSSGFDKHDHPADITAADDIENSLTSDTKQGIENKTAIRKINPGMQGIETGMLTQHKPTQLKLADNGTGGKKPLSPEKKKRFPIEIGLQLTGGYSFMSTDVDEQSVDKSVNRYYSGIQTSAQKHGFSYGANLLVKFPLSKTFSVMAGIGKQYWDVRGEYNFNRSFIPIYDRYNKEIAYIEDPSLKHYQYSAKKSFTQVQIPVGGEITLPAGKKWQIGLSGGLTYNIFKSASGTTANCIYLTNQSLNETSDLKNTYISWHFGAGVYLPISQKLRLGIIPEYHHCTSSILNSDSGVNWYPSAIDITTTLLFKL